MAFVIVGIVGAVCSIVFGVRINEISIYVRGTIMLILSIIVFVAKIVFDIEYDKRQRNLELEEKKNEDNDKIEVTVEND